MLEWLLWWLLAAFVFALAVSAAGYIVAR